MCSINPTHTLLWTVQLSWFQVAEYSWYMLNVINYTQTQIELSPYRWCCWVTDINFVIGVICSCSSGGIICHVTCCINYLCFSWVLYQITICIDKLGIIDISDIIYALSPVIAFHNTWLYLFLFWCVSFSLRLYANYSVSKQNVMSHSWN